MLLTVFGMLSEKMVIKDIGNTRAYQIPVIVLYSLTTASIRESIVLNMGQVSWLVTLLPSFSYRFGDTMDIGNGNNSFALLTVARQPVIFTRFLFHSGSKTRKPQVEIK